MSKLAGADAPDGIVRQSARYKALAIPLETMHITEIKIEADGAALPLAF